LPDGLLSNQKSQFGKIWEGFRLENVDTWYIFPVFGIIHQEKSGNPVRESTLTG
jgi:hypothetical protein